MAKCQWCVKGRYQGFNDPHPKTCDKCGGTGTLNDAGTASEGLIHGMYRPLCEKLDAVRSWPGVTGRMLDAAIKEATDSGRIDRFNAESPTNKGLNVVVSVYQDNAPDTLIYARDRMMEAFGERYSRWYDAYKSGITHNRVRYLQDGNGNTLVPVYRNCVRIEVVDLFANWDPVRGMVPRAVRNAESAHFAVLYAAVQDPDWVWAMDGKKVPHTAVGGLELNVSGYDPWPEVPSVRRNCCEAYLNGGRYDFRFRYMSLPSLRE